MLIIIGLDAADYGLTKKFVGEGVMPRLERVATAGNFSCLRSVIPPNTAPGWTSITTGVNPGKHGIYYFYDFSTVPLTIVNSTRTSTPRIWDYVRAVKKKSVMVNVPVTYPVREVSGSIIAGIPPWFIDERSIYPASLGNYLRETSYETDAPTSRALEEKPDELVPRSLETEERRVKVFCDLLAREDDPGFGMVVITALDRLQHKLVGKNQDAAVRRAYGMTDALVGKIVDRFPESDFLIVSDHGFGYTPVAFYPNSWLYQNGFLERKSSARYRLTKRLHDFFDGRFLWIPKAVTKRFQGAATLVRSIDAVDVLNSRAFVPGTDGIVVVKSSGNIARIREGLSLLKDEEGKEICKVYGKNEIYRGDKLDSAPELLIVPREDVNIRSDPFAENIVTRSGVFPRGNHGPNGIFFAAGPSIRKCDRNLNLSLEDITPTSLSILGIKPPEELDGRVVSEVLYDSGNLASTLVDSQENRAYSFSQSEEDLVMDNLRRLGYT